MPWRFKGLQNIIKARLAKVFWKFVWCCCYSAQLSVNDKASKNSDIEPIAKQMD